ncbi:hypothetical protein [Roseitranquillus sediminis]|uniref:hypothetical protein n=1 Tax=Roseitranquillus sediminis TaxID=2809051 RepID=UPI001D0C200C|nr:hypothetical protein [Roseitranquillus sediminis]MBM9593618.1 hypothetical protein [Roseitranquillus sediminis]
MIRRLLPAALGLLALPAAAQECPHTGGPDNCSRVLACVGDDGLWFDGRAIGWGHGTVAGELSDGTLCTGEWAYQSAITSRTYISCDNGMEAVVIAVSQDPPTATSIGEGQTSDGRRITA